MEKGQEYKPEIADIYTGSGWLFINDALDIGRLHFRAGSEKDGKKIRTYAYLDAYKAYPALLDLSKSGALSPRTYSGHKATYYGGSVVEGKVVSRIIEFRIDQDPNRRQPVYISVSSGPGEKNRAGAIAPKKGASREDVFISLTVEQARQLFSAVRFAVEAWMMRQRPTNERSPTIQNTNPHKAHSEGAPPQEENGKTPDDAMGRNKATELWKLAQAAGFTSDAFNHALSRAFKEFGVDSAPDLPESLYPNWEAYFSSPLHAPKHNLATREEGYDTEDKASAHTDEWKRMWGRSGDVVETLNQIKGEQVYADWDDMRPKYLKYVTGRIDSAADLAYQECVEINEAFHRFLKKYREDSTPEGFAN